MIWRQRAARQADELLKLRRELFGVERVHRARRDRVGAGRAPDLPRDPDLVTDEDLDAYAAGLARHGFFGPDSWYMNGDRNVAYAARARDGGRLSLPVLFLHGEYDYTCETVHSRLAEPMRRDCRDLTELVVPSGHWMAQEKPRVVNAALAKWIATKLPDVWPTP